MAAKPRYIFQRYRRWWFRMAVPAKLWSLHGRAIQENLHTEDINEAEVLALGRARHWKALFNGISDASPGDTHGPREAYAAAYARGRHLKAEVATAGYSRREAEEILSTEVSLILEAEAERQGVEDTSEIEEVNTTPIFRAELAGIRAALAGIAPSAPAAQEPFSKLAARYLADRQRPGASRRMTNQTVGQMEAVYRLFRDHCADAPLRDTTPQQAARFFDKVKTLAAHWGRSPKTKQRTLDELVTLSATIPGTRLSDRTLFRYMVALVQLWDWAKPREGFTGDNPFSGLLQKTEAPGEKNRPWPEPALVALLYGAPDKSRPGKPDPFFWVPRIALLSGMRPNEICELEAEDIKSADGVAYFDITRAKTSAGVRVVPVHSALLPFLALAPKTGHLFPILKPGGPDQKRWWNVSKVFGRRLRKIEGATTFYGLRKNVIQSFERQRIPQTEAAQIVGHGRRGITYSVYSPDGLRIDQKRDIIELLRLPPRSQTPEPFSAG